MKTSTKQHWEKEIAELWPSLKGSVAKVHKPCIRPNCPVCRAGTKHPAWIYSYSENGKRRCLYVPKEMVSTMELAIKNGRKLEKLLYEMGPALLKEYRQSVKSKRKPPARS